KDVPIIEIQVKPGDRVTAEAPLVTLESDKASMEVPSPSAGVVKTIAVKLGDKVSEGTPILTLEVDGADARAEPAKPAVSAPPAPGMPDAAFEIPYAGPSVRKLARERGIDLRQVKGGGPRGRILPEDVQGFTQAPAVAPSAPVAAGAGLNLLPWPKVDFAKFGP